MSKLVRAQAPPTLETIAREVGLSKSTVSRALRDSPNQSRATCLRVQRTAQAMGYRTNPMLAAWMARVRGGCADGHGAGTCLALADTFPTEADWRSWRHLSWLEEGARSRAAELGCSLERIPFARGGTKPDHFPRRLQARGIAGVVLLPFKQFGTTLPFSPQGLSLVAIGHSMTTPDVSRVEVNYFQTWMHVMQALADRGFRRPAFCNLVTVDLRNSGNMWAGYWTASRQLFGRDACPGLNLEATEDARRRKQRFARWRETHQPDIVVFNKQWLLEEVAPDEKGVMLFLHPRPGTKHPYAYVDLRWPEIGRAAIDLLFQQLIQHQTGIPTVPVIHLVAGRPVLRGLTAIRRG